MAKFPETLAGAEVSDIDLEHEEFQFNRQRLTEQRAEELSEHAFRRSDNLIPGGKSLSGGGKHSPIVQARVSETTRNTLQALAAARGCSVSKLTRTIIEDYVAQTTQH